MYAFYIGPAQSMRESPRDHEILGHTILRSEVYLPTSRRTGRKHATKHTHLFYFLKPQHTTHLKSLQASGVETLCFTGDPQSKVLNTEVSGLSDKARRSSAPLKSAVEAPLRAVERRAGRELADLCEDLGEAE